MDNQTLAALEQVLLTARIAHTTGTDAEWTAANPVLLKGEIGFVGGTSPVKFKVGDGEKRWSELRWGQPTLLGQLTPDAEHQLVTSDQVARWDANVLPSTLPPTMITEDTTHRFTTDAEKAKWNLEYTIEKAATESGYASTYHLKKGGSKVGVSINIPLDQVLRGSSIKSVTTAGSPYTGAKVGDKYIEFLFQNNSTPQYLPVQDLVDVYKGDDNYIEVTSTNIVRLNYAALKTKLQSDFGSVFDAKGAGADAAAKAIDDFKASTFVIQCTIPGMS